jgi:hypothetical protein
MLAGLMVAMIWPAFCNRGPFYFVDTRTYMRGIDAVMNKLTHRQTAWTAPANKPAAASGNQPRQDADKKPSNSGDARTRSIGEITKQGIMLGRSLYYGLLLYIGAVAGGFWLTILMQSATVLLVLYLVLRALAYPAWPTLAWLCLGLCLVSDLSFFASYLMPDLFAAFAILACAFLISSPERLALRDGAPWFLLLTASMLCHDTCFLLSVSFLGFAILANLFQRSFGNLRGLGIILLASFTAWAGQSLVTYGVTRATGQPPLRFPLIEARLVADGPGTNYLRSNCPESRFTLCEYVDEFPMNSYAFLFDVEPGKSVYEIASYDQRRALSAEQFRFLLAVLKFDPAGVAKSGMRNTAAQLLDFGLSKFRYDPGEKETMDRTFPLQALAQMRAGAAYRGTMPAAALTVLLYLFVSGSLAYVLLVLFGLLPGRSMNHRLKTVFCWIITGIVLNAAICGGISAVESRYQARVVWLIPLVALLVEARACIDRHKNLLPQDA